MGSGPSSQQKQARNIEVQNAKLTQDLAKQNASKFSALYGQVQPFYTQQMTNGLPFYGSLTDYAAGNAAQAYAPVRGDFLRRTSTLGYLPSGFKQGGLNDINDAQAHEFDQGLQGAQFANYGTKQQGAAGLSGLAQIVNPSSFYGLSTQAASGATQPLRGAPSPWASIIGGAAQGAASALPF